MSSIELYFYQLNVLINMTNLYIDDIIEAVEKYGKLWSGMHLRFCDSEFHVICIQAGMPDTPSCLIQSRYHLCRARRPLTLC